MLYLHELQTDTQRFPLFKSTSDHILLDFVTDPTLANFCSVGLLYIAEVMVRVIEEVIMKDSAIYPFVGTRNDGMRLIVADRRW
ncbi:hypothetical protein GCM10022408_13190 [Hymenobacter fastidiosus]|uniref:Uncharacterized protein n=1 Tax=Hymenobacter fastidiosus TaxID=486264 RepID=A0ABP7RWL7_9BACT